jgi:hypothetical protein
MDATVTISGSQLLKAIHVSKLKIIMSIHMIGKSNKDPVLVKIIIDNLLSKIDKHFIVCYK